MTVNHLDRALAPIEPLAWEAIEGDAKPRLVTYLAGRKLVDFSGPFGWQHSSTNLGRTQPIASIDGGLAVRQRRVLPLVEMRAEFTASRQEIDDAGRGAQDIDLPGLDAACRQLAVAENRVVFHGYPAAGMAGMTDSSAHEPLTLGAAAGEHPQTVARAVDRLRQSGVDGPYALAIAPAIYTTIVETTEHGGYPVLEHLHQILGGPVVWALGIDGGVVLSQRGGDFVFESGEDISIGYRDHTRDDVQLYLEESFSFRVLEPQAAIALRATGAEPIGRRGRGR
jgi:uncharacterized linocin/CFP29 family protein